MKKIYIIFSLLLLPLYSHAQTTKYPVYKGCENESKSQLESCFLENVSTDFYQYFNHGEVVPSESSFYIIFIASKNGTFDIVQISTNDVAVKDEVARVFAKLSKFEPATFNGNPIDKQYILHVPLDEFVDVSETQTEEKLHAFSEKNTFEYKPLQSQLRMPFSQFSYNLLDDSYFKEKAHTSVKPYIYNATLDAQVFSDKMYALQKHKTSWWGRKFWNEHFAEVSGDHFWFQFDPLIDVQLGKDNSDLPYTYNNTRAACVAGNLYEKVSFSSTIYESQGRFATYFNNYVTTIRPASDGAGIVPGQGLAKSYGDRAYDYPLATGYISYAPNQVFNFQFGRDKNFIGDGYRSMFLSDVATPSTFFKIQTNFWHIQYTNLWLWLRDVNVADYEDTVFKRKFAAIHHLSWQVNAKLNIGLFESVVWAKTADQGFDVDYLNPIIFYRPIEFSIGSKKGNAMIGMNASYHFAKNVNLYAQILFDEITVKELTGSDGYWANKYAFQMGLKYNKAFNINNLTLQGEYNMVRPYTYSHNNPEINFGHYNQSLAHPWGSNFREGVLIADYQKNRWFARAKAVGGIKGFDYNSATDSYSYGGDIYRDYSSRNDNYGIKTGQGNKANIFIGEFKAGYIVNPATQLKLFGSVLYRSFNAPVADQFFKNGTTSWFTVGLQSDISNWYFDF